MKKILFYIFIFLIAVNIFVNGLVSIMNLIILGIFVNLIYRKKETGAFSMWKLIVGIGITACCVLIGLARILKII